VQWYRSAAWSRRWDARCHVAVWSHQFHHLLQGSCCVAGCTLACNESIPGRFVCLDGGGGGLIIGGGQEWMAGIHVDNSSGSTFWIFLCRISLLSMPIVLLIVILSFIAVGWNKRDGSSNLRRAAPLHVGWLVQCWLLARPHSRDGTILLLLILHPSSTAHVGSAMAASREVGA